MWRLEIFIVIVSFQLNSTTVTMNIHRQSYIMLAHLLLLLLLCDSVCRSSINMQRNNMYSFIGNAEMTEIFKCRKSGTKCCAPKSLIREALGHNGIDKIHQESTIQEPISTMISTTTSQPITEFSSTS